MPDLTKRSGRRNFRVSRRRLRRFRIVTGDQVVGGVVLHRKRRFFRATARFGLGTAAGERAAGRRIDRGRRIALQHHPAAHPVARNRRQRREQRSGIGMARAPSKIAAVVPSSTILPRYITAPSAWTIAWVPIGCPPRSGVWTCRSSTSTTAGGFPAGSVMANRFRARNRTRDNQRPARKSAAARRGTAVACWQRGANRQLVGPIDRQQFHLNQMLNQYSPLPYQIAHNMLCLCSFVGNTIAFTHSHLLYNMCQVSPTQEFSLRIFLTKEHWHSIS